MGSGRRRIAGVLSEWEIERSSKVQIRAQRNSQLISEELETLAESELRKVCGLSESMKISEGIGKLKRFYRLFFANRILNFGFLYVFTFFSFYFFLFFF